MKKELRQPKRLSLPRETLRQLSDADLKQPAGGTCYTDVVQTQCCPAA